VRVCALETKQWRLISLRIRRLILLHSEWWMRNLPGIFLIKSLGIWFVCALAVTVPLSRINLVRFYRLQNAGVATKAVVTGLEEANHQSVYYAYHIEGNAFSGIGRGGFGNPEFPNLRVGQRVTVFYLPRSPSESCLGLPDKLIANELPPIILAGIVVPPFVITMFSWRYPPFKRWLLRQRK
jgi:hypothetical protein